MQPLKELLAFCILNIDKPSGPTSGQVSAYVREQLGVAKTSHMGTLDPAVGGVLPITINRACKLSPYLLNKEKAYVGIMRLHTDVGDKQLKQALTHFQGTIKQRPPVRSNVKRVVRERTILTFEILERYERDVLFRTQVEAGTYIRTLIHDLGKTMGGAHMLELRRTRAGYFHEETAVTLYAFDKAVEAWKNGDEAPLKAILIPAETVIRALFPVLRITQKRLKEILRGKPIHTVDMVPASLRNIPERNTHIAVFCEDLFVEMARVVNEKDVVAVPEFVFN